MQALALFLLLAWGSPDWRPTNQPGHQALFVDGKQVGSIELATGVYHKLENGRFVKAECPVPKPGEAVFAAKGEVQNFGLNLSEDKFTEGESFSFNGKAIDRAAAFTALGEHPGAGDTSKKDPEQFTDDSTKPRLTIVGPDAPRKEALAAFKRDARTAELVNDQVVIKDFPPKHWQVTGKGFATKPNQVTYHLTDADGKVLYEGTESAGVFDALRRKKNSWDMTWFNWSIGINPWTWAPTLGFSFFNLPGDLVVTVLVLIIAGIWLLPKRPA